MAGPVAQSLWLALPAALTGILHMVVVKRGLWPRLAVPLDGGQTFRGAPLFGPNKTWRGALFIVAAGAALGLVQGLVAGPWAAARGLLPVALEADGRAGLALGYAGLNAVLGVGYVLGELPNSFLKRRIAIAPGRTASGAVGLAFFLLDQADSVIGALGLAALVFGIPGRVLAAGILALTLLHLAINGTLFALRLRRHL